MDWGRVGTGMDRCVYLFVHGGHGTSCFTHLSGSLTLAQVFKTLAKQHRQGPHSATVAGNILEGRVESDLS